MYDQRQTQFVGNHDYDDQAAEKMAGSWAKTFSIGIFKWELANSGKAMKRGRVLVRVTAPCEKEKEAFVTAEDIVKDLDAGKWDGRKTVKIK